MRAPVSVSGLGARAARPAAWSGRPDRVRRWGRRAWRGRLDVGDDPLRAPSPSAMRLAARTRRLETGSGRCRPAAARRTGQVRCDRVVAHVVAHLGVHALARSAAAPARAARSGCPCGRSSRTASRGLLAGGRPCPPAGAGAGHRAAGRSARPRRRARRCESGTVSRTMHAGDPGDHVVQALDVLHVDRRCRRRCPASSSSSTSCQRLAWREPGALVWASSSTSISAGRRASAASRSNSAQRGAAVLDRPARQDLQAAQQRLGLGAPVRLDLADHARRRPAPRCSRAASSMA